MVTAGRKTRVVVVDDSALIRNLLTSIINEAPDMEVVATASDPLVARERIRETNPDIITLDIEMPHMDGLEFLRRLMRLRPMPVLMISSLTQKGSEMALAALELGALDVFPKPVVDVSQTMHDYAEDIRERIRAIAGKPVRPLLVKPVPPALPATKPSITGQYRQNAIIVVGASTGGTEAIKEFLSGFPAECPPILLVQHMPELFTASFARRLNGICAMTVKEAEQGEPVCHGVAYIAPGHSHMRLYPGAQGFQIALDQSDPVNRHRPAVDVLFASAARYAAEQCIGVLLTGMGKDGAQGMLSLYQAGAMTFAQDEQSCVVYGMPKEAVKLGGVREVYSLAEMPSRVQEFLSVSKSSRLSRTL